MLINTVSELKINFIEEKKKPNTIDKKNGSDSNKTDENNYVSENNSGEEK
jgi:hypothetical protein